MVGRRSKLTIKECACGKKALKCKAMSNNRHCRLRPRICGYCAIHCKLNKRSVKK